MQFLLYTLLFAATAHFNVNGQADYCFGDDQEKLQTRHFSSLTSYEVAHGTNMAKDSLVPDCEPQKVWILHRHGTRLPTKHVIEQIPRLEELRDEIKKNWESKSSRQTAPTICLKDYYLIKMWNRNASITPDKAEYLTSQGYTDLRGTAKTYRNIFPGILAKPYDSKQFLFRHTDSQRTTESFKAFAEGLFGADSNARAEPVPAKDYLLRPYDMCDSWKEHLYKGPGTEDYKFQQTELWNRTIMEVSRRLGFQYALEESDVQLMYDMCRYETAWKPDYNGVWCAAFTPEHISVFEYQQDIHYYYKNGYGYDENSRLNCRVVKDMLQHLKSSSQPNAITYFAHSTAVQTLLSALGIAKDESPLLASSYNQMSTRQWMASVIDPFASNFVAVKYDCPANPVQREHVLFFLNQKVLLLDWCNVGLCSMSDIMKRYENFANADCDSYYCRSGSATIGASLATLLLAAIVYLIY